MSNIPPPPGPGPGQFHQRQTPPQPPGPTLAQVRQWNMLCHLSTLSGFVFPLGSILGPLLVWQIKKMEIPSVQVHGKEAINFQITLWLCLLIGGLVFGLLGVIGAVAIGGLAPVAALPVLVGFGYLGGLAMFLSGIIFPIIAGIRANEGRAYKYPVLFRVL